jgi:branched-chain amino acid transport system permease protein
MIEFLHSHQPVFDFFLLALGFAYSQQIVLRCGVFSLATAAFAALGAYACALLFTRIGAPAPVAVAVALALGAASGWLVSIPLARLRGVYQAIATLGLVEVVVSLALYAEPLTGGAVGLNSIPKAVGTTELLLAVLGVGYVVHSLSGSGLGRSFDALRQDETVAASLGVSSRRDHALAFVLSGAIGGLFGALQSLYAYSVQPTQFDFAFMVATLTAIILGGRRSLMGPAIGAAILTLLPELARPLAEYRPLVNGLILILVVVFLPQGVGDGLLSALRHRRARKAASLNGKGALHGNA